MAFRLSVCMESTCKIKCCWIFQRWRHVSVNVAETIKAHTLFEADISESHAVCEIIRGNAAERYISWMIGNDTVKLCHNGFSYIGLGSHRKLFSLPDSFPMPHHSNYLGYTQWRTLGRGVGVGFNPPPKFRRPSKNVPNSTWLWKLLKMAEFRKPTLQDVRKNGGRVLKLPPVRNCFT